MNDGSDPTTNRDDLPEGHAQLVIREDDVTIVIQGPSEDVQERLYDHLDDKLGTDGAEIEEYPMPDTDEGLVPAEEFYADGEA